MVSRLIFIRTEDRKECAISFRELGWGYLHHCAEAPALQLNWGHSGERHGDCGVLTTADQTLSPKLCPTFVLRSLSHLPSPSP